MRCGRKHKEKHNAHSGDIAPSGRRVHTLHQAAQATGSPTGSPSLTAAAVGGFGHTDGQQSFAHLAGYWHGACKVRRGLENCVQTEGLHGALGAVHGRLKSLECAFNLLPAGLASNQFVNHVVATSRRPAATPKRQPLGGGTKIGFWLPCGGLRGLPALPSMRRVQTFCAR